MGGSTQWNRYPATQSHPQHIRGGNVGAKLKRTYLGPKDSKAAVGVRDRDTESARQTDRQTNKQTFRALPHM